jgi:hypothetical protein
MNTKIERIRQIFDDMNKLRLDDYSYSSFKRNISSILMEVNGLIAEEQDEQKKLYYQHAYSALAHTDNKEVEFVKYHQDLMRKKNAAKVRRTEYFDAVEKAYDQVYIDLILILK